jgi:hypothetical protein
MSESTNKTTDAPSIPNQFAEDPDRQPHEKETAWHLEGDATHFSITSFKKVCFSKLLARSNFSVNRIHILDSEGTKQTRGSLREVIAEPDLTIIGVEGQLPVGALSIGSPRKDNSHARIVK